jgi:exosortase/archaeosortase family protein
VALAWLYRPVFDYLAVIFSREDFRANQVALAGVLVLIGIRAAQARKSRPRLRLDATPQLSVPALSLALGGSALYLVVERFLDINTLSASLFGLATYGLLGLWLEPRRWRQGLLAALLLIGTLPFGEHMQTFIGYPVRILTADGVRNGLATAGVASINMDTILVLENGVSQVDLPCSGVKSLWTGMLFLLAATWTERRALNLRWFLTALIFAALLLAANLARVGILVVVGQVADWRLAAEMLHVPLGVLGFATACAVAAALLRRQRAQDDAAPVRAWPALPRPAWLAPSLAGDTADWLPAWVPAAAPVKPVAHRVDLPGGETVIARPVVASDLPKPPAGLRLAVALDRSRSMADRAADVRAVLARLAEVSQSGATIEVYLTASKYRGEAPARIGLAALDPRILYYGGQNAAELLAQFNALHASEKYDAIFVLTDGTGYELGGSNVKVPVPDAPVWMIHLGGNLPLGYDDATLEAIQASGGYFAMKEGLLYPTLHRMTQEGLVTGEWRPAGPTRRRKYYAITDKGHQVLSEQSAEWRAFIEKLLGLLNTSTGTAS